MLKGTYIGMGDTSFPHGRSLGGNIFEYFESRRLVQLYYTWSNLGLFLFN